MFGVSVIIIVVDDDGAIHDHGQVVGVLAAKLDEAHPSETKFSRLAV